MLSIEQAFNLALDHHQAGRLAEAAPIYRQILKLHPRHSNSLYFLGRLELDGGNFEPAEHLFRRAIETDGSNAFYFDYLAQSLQAQGKLTEAISAYREAIRLHPNYAIARANLAGALETEGSLVEAESSFLESLRVESGLTEAHFELGNFLVRQQRWSEARDCYLEAVRQRPTFFQAQTRLGQVLHNEGLFRESAHVFQQALMLCPNDAMTYFYLAVALQFSGRSAEACGAFEECLRLEPQHAAAYSSLGEVFMQMDKRDEAIVASRKAIEIDPNVYAYSSLAICLLSQGRHDDAMETFRTAVRVHPDDARQHSNLLYALNFHPGYDAPAIFAEHRRWAERHADPLAVGHRPHLNDRDPQRRLRIGYVSSHFRQHAVNFFSEPMLAAHDHATFEIFCYSNVAQKDCDDVTRRVRDYADHWREIAAKTDEQASQLVRDDQIDILVDLAGHIGGDRLLLFARKPAPIQVTYLGYQNTTGMAAMDYRLTDAWSDPPGMTEAYYSETLVRLPRTFFCYHPIDDSLDITPLPAGQRGFITFGSFNNFAKVTPQVIAAWAQIMTALPGSRLVLWAIVGETLNEYVYRSFEAYGVERQRIDLQGRRPLREFRELIAQVDIALDPFPFNGHTTTCDSLWMGVPVIMLAGTTYASRFGSSALVALGLADLIATTCEQYVRNAVSLAQDIPRLTSLRLELRDRMSRSPILEAGQFTRYLEAAYREMWIAWCRKLPGK